MPLLAGLSGLAVDPLADWWSAAPRRERQLEVSEAALAHWMQKQLLALM